MSFNVLSLIYCQSLNRYNLSVKYRIGYRYRQISVIKNRNIGISAFSHIGASLLKINQFSVVYELFLVY